MGSDNLSVKETGRRLGFCSATVRRWINRGLLPCVKFGRNVRIPREAVEEFSKKGSASA